MSEIKIIFGSRQKLLMAIECPVKIVIE